MSKKRKKQPVNSIIIISDLHVGCRFGLHPDNMVMLDGGMESYPSVLQKKVYGRWEEFWGDWVPQVTRGEPYAVVVNGDTTDGVHHGSVTQISQNLSDQRRIAKILLKPIVDLCEGRFYMIRGTEAHVGKSGQNEETLAEELNAVPDELKHYSRYEMWVELGEGLVHILHHIGTTGSMAYETTALMKEYTEACSDAGRWGRKTPDCVVRSHRHRFSKVDVASKTGDGICICTPGWQLRTPFAYRIPGARLATPQLGGILVRSGDEDKIYTRHKVWSVERDATVKFKPVEM